MLHDGALIPEDIWRLIYQELIPQEDGYAVWKPSPFDEKYKAPSRHVLNLSSTCRRLRTYGEPYVFRRITFSPPNSIFYKPKKIDAFYKSSTARLKGLLGSERLKLCIIDLRVNFWFVDDNNKVALQKSGFWELFLRALRHLTFLKQVALNIPLQSIELSGCPPTPQQTIYSEHKRGPVRKTVSIREGKEDSSISLRSRTVPPRQDVSHLENPSGPVVFSSIRTAAVMASSHCIIDHCPNLTKYIHLDNGFPYDPSNTKLTYLGHSSLTALCLDQKACRRILTEISRAFPQIEELAMYPPSIQHVVGFRDESYYRELTIEELAELPSVFKLLPRLRVFALHDPFGGGSVLPHVATAPLTLQIHQIVIEIGTKGRALREIHFGKVVRYRAENWAGQIDYEKDHRQWQGPPQ